VIEREEEYGVDKNILSPSAESTLYEMLNVNIHTTSYGVVQQQESVYGTNTAPLALSEREIYNTIYRICEKLHGILEF